jgi:hypothetical protein
MRVNTVHVSRATVFVRDVLAGHRPAECALPADVSSRNPRPVTEPTITLGRDEVTTMDQIPTFLAMLGLSALSMALAAVFVACLGYFVNRIMLRRYARELVADWRLQLELLDIPERVHALRNPPPDIAEALAILRR